MNVSVDYDINTEEDNYGIRYYDLLTDYMDLLQVICCIFSRSCVQCTYQHGNLNSNQNDNGTLL